MRATGQAPEVAAVRRGRFQLSANPRLLYEPVPGLAYEVGGPTRFFEWRGRSNRMGFRDRERAPAKPPGTYRVVVLGDSIAAGYRVERAEEVFPALLERSLAGGPPDRPAVEVLNFAVTGYNTAQEVELLRARALPFSPDLVLLAWCHNDRRPPDPRILAALRDAEGGRRLLAPAAADQALTWSALYRLARWGLRRAPQEGIEESDPGEGSWRGVEGALAELAALARRHD
ncbi:MAG: SGNH/GDSL hydrolase family protein, partial [Thermoanaerobaculia bacterium]